MSAYKKPWNVLRSKKAYGLKISQSIIYVKEYLYMFFFLPSKHIPLNYAQRNI